MNCTTCILFSLSSYFADIMVKMGFTISEVTESLKSNKYDDVMATYLLLDENRLTSAETIHIDSTFIRNANSENAIGGGGQNRRKPGKENKRYPER